MATVCPGRMLGNCASSTGTAICTPSETRVAMGAAGPAVAPMEVLLAEMTPSTGAETKASSR